MSREKTCTRKLIFEVKAVAIAWKRIIWLMVDSRDAKGTCPVERDALLRIQRNLTADLIEIEKIVNGGLGSPRSALSEADILIMRCGDEMRNPAVATNRARVANEPPKRVKRSR